MKYNDYPIVDSFVVFYSKYFDYKVKQQQKQQKRKKRRKKSIEMHELFMIVNTFQATGYFIVKCLTVVLAMNSTSRSFVGFFFFCF